MAWRGLHLTQPARLSLKDGQIAVAQDDGEARIPLEDLAFVVLDSPQATLTSALLSALMSAGIAVVVTDETHTPSGLALPFHRNFRQGDVARRQAEMTTPLKKRIWQAIVQRKIENQAALLARLGRPGAETLRGMMRRVGSGDPENVEARAARFYWSRLWPDFRREDEGDRRNMLVNYGYAVARSAVARSLVACGLLPCFGLMHASGANAFNLADDFVEPFRPFVDALAWRTVGDGRPSRERLSVEDRRAMAAVAFAEARIGLDTVTLLVAAERVSLSLLSAIESASPAPLELPALPAVPAPVA
jgi:CRISPR-associated protein Cas1